MERDSVEKVSNDNVIVTQLGSYDEVFQLDFHSAARLRVPFLLLIASHVAFIAERRREMEKFQVMCTLVVVFGTGIYIELIFQLEISSELQIYLPNNGSSCRVSLAHFHHLQPLADTYTRARSV